jgi:hypothetical protein
MSKLGSFELVADKNVKAGEKTSIASLFPTSERSKEYQLLEDVREGAKLQISISKVKPLESMADGAFKKGDRVTSFRIIKYADFIGDAVTSEDIKAGDKLSISFEAAGLS